MQDWHRPELAVRVRRKRPGAGQYLFGIDPLYSLSGFVVGVIVGLMFMEDEKGLDSKVVLSPIGSGGAPLYELTDAERNRIGSFFNRYKEGQPGLFSRVTGWGTIADGLAYIKMTHRFFLDCRQRAGVPCRI